MTGEPAPLGAGGFLWGMQEHVQLLQDTGLPIPAESTDPTITVRNEPQLAMV